MAEQLHIRPIFAAISDERKLAIDALALGEYEKSCQASHDQQGPSRFSWLQHALNIEPQRSD